MTDRGGKIRVNLGTTKTRKRAEETEKSFDRGKFIMDVEEYLHFEKRFSALNVKNTMHVIKRLVEHYGIITPCIEDARRVEEDLKSMDRKNGTIKHYLRGMELMAEFQGLPLKLKKPKRVYRTPEYLTPMEARALLDSCPYVRDRAIIAALLFCGLRNRELVSLDIEDVDLKNRFLYIRDRGQGIKNRSERKAVMTRECCDHLKEWLDIRPTIPGNNALFYSIEGQRISKHRLTNIVREAGMKAGIEKHVYPHMLRHTCGSNMEKSGIPLTEVALQLGHKSLSSTMIYLHSNFESLKGDIDKKFYY